MDNDYGIDVSEVLRTVAGADVMMFRFVTVPQRLLIDMRCDGLDGPMVKLVARATSIEERFRGLKQLRPRFPVPDRIAGVWWPRYIDSIETCGVWEGVMRRIVDSGYSRATDEATATLQELRDAERREIQNAIRGEGYRSLWESRV